MDSRRTVSPESALASDIFDKFCGANTLKSILGHYRQLCSVLRIKPTHFPDFYPRLKNKLSSWRAQGLWTKFEKRASHKCYGRGKACFGTRVLIIGSGPCGLRAAIEAQMLGAKVVLVEKRDRFSRNNVLHLWPFVICDLKALGAKKFYGKFCAGSIDHISIRQLQCILLKVALLLGVEVHEGVSFDGLRQPTDNEGWRANTSPADHPVSHYNFDVLIGADGRRNTLDGFRRKALRAKLAIAITANFINKHTEAEARVKEISGVSYIFNQKFFQDLNEATGIDLENIVYYKDETHYFVMTAKKQSLLQKGVLLHDYADTAKLLSHENISTENLMIYALEAAIFSTENQLPNLEYAVNHYGLPDVAMFDFTQMYTAENACRVVERKNHKLLMTLVGDSLIESFWPQGTGCARGFLSSFDACWMIRSWAGGAKSPLEVMAERESIYRLLAQTTPENLNKEHTSYTIDPHSRYPNLNQRAVMPFQVKSLLDTDETIPDVTDSLPAEGQQLAEAEKIAKKRRRDSVIAVDALLSWMRDQIACYGIELTDVREAFVNGDVLCAIIHRFRPDLIEFPLPSEENVDPISNAAFRNQLAFDLLHEEYGLTHVMSGWDSVTTCSSDFLSCVAYLSQIYEIFRGEIPQIKYPRVESCEDLEEAEQRSSQLQIKYTINPKVAKHHYASSKTPGRRSRMSSSGRESREGDSETSARRHKKRRSEDRIRSNLSGIASVSSSHPASSGSSCREIRTTLGGRRAGRGDDGDSEKNVPGLARDLEAKLKGRGETSSSSSHDRQKPKDLIRAIGKIEKTDWNVQLIEKKIAESKGPSVAKADRDDKVPKWSREAFDDKREALKRKMEGTAQAVAGGEVDANDKLQLFEETMKKLNSKLKCGGNTLEVGQRGSNKVSAMAEQLVHKLDKPEAAAPKQQSNVPRPVFEFPKKGGSECCHFCKERVYVVERMTAEGKFFHRNCFRCEYCNTALRVGNYVFDREGRYGDRFFCTAHSNTTGLYSWKKYEQEMAADLAAKPSLAHRAAGHHPMTTPTSQQILSEMDERGTTPERVEFENSVECASEDDLLSEMDEDEWTDRNFGASNADNNTPDEASDLSEDDDITPEGIKGEDVNHHGRQLAIPERPAQPEVNVEAHILAAPKKDHLDSSDSDTEVASGDESVGSLEDDELDDDAGDEAEEEEDDEDDEDEEDEEEDEDEGGGSTTEIETDSEFAEDPPHSVPGTIPTIVVDEPEQIVTRMIDSTPISHTQTPTLKQNRRDHHHHHHNHNHHNNHQSSTIPPIYHIEDLNNRMVEPVKKTTVPERPLPRVTAVPKKWEPLSINPEGFGSKISLELKKKYLQGSVPGILGTAAGAKNKPLGQQDATAQNQFRSVLDMISEQQKLLQPAPKPSATMQAFLDGAEKLKNKTSISPLSVSPRAVDDKVQDGQILGNMIPPPPTTVTAQMATTTVAPTNNWNNELNHDSNHGAKNGTANGVDSMNRLNLEKTIEACQAAAEAAAAAAVAAANEGQPSGVKRDLSKDRLSTTPGQEKQDLGKEKEEHLNLSHVEHELTSSDSEQIHQMMLASTLLMVNGGSSSTASESPPVLSDGMSQSETETQSTIIVTNKNAIVDPAKTPVAEKPFESLEPSKPERSSRNLEPSEEDDDSDTEAGSVEGEPLSDLEDLDIEDEDLKMKIEPPRVEIEDEFGGVTLAIDVDAEIDESIRVSSSSSRDSLNSGVFLETELSDWSKDGGHECSEIGDVAVKDNNNKAGRRAKSAKGHHGKSRGSRKAEHQQPTSAAVAEKSHLALELEDMDFMDVDGCLSSPDDPHFRRKPEGYVKLAAHCTEEEEENSDSIPPGFNVVLRQQSHEEQPSPNTLERQQRTTYSSDDQDESGHSSTPTVESMSAGFPPKEDPPPVPVTEAVNPVLVQHKKKDKDSKKKETAAEVAMLDKVGPFSNARDSLDYRKMKGITSPTKSRDLYSTYCLPSVKGDLPEEQMTSLPLEEATPQQRRQYHQLQHQSSSLSSSSSSSKVKPSPEMARKIEEINKERAKQNDLIRSMVMGRIRKSPEKNSRRGSRGSLSPLGGASSSGSSGSASGSNEHVLRCGDPEQDQLTDSRRSSQNSILSHSHDGEVEAEENSSLNEIELPSRDDSNSSAAEPILQRERARLQSGSSSQISTSGESIPHQKLVKSTSTTPSQSSPPHPHPPQFSSHQHQAAYEPVFASSPRFRHRPKFETPLSVYQSVTNPPTPVNPSHVAGYSPSILTPSSDDTASSTNGHPTKHNVASTNNGNDQVNKSIKSFKSHSPSFYRSMPDLSAFLVTPVPSVTPTHQDNIPVSTDPNGGFITPDVKQWENYKNVRGAATSVDREKARQAARERARLKSDEELGLSPTDYANLKEKVRRKASIPESDDVFSAPGRQAIGGSVPTTPVRESIRGGVFHHPSRRLARPMSDVFDAAFSLRPNVDFPIGKTNPFLVPASGPGGTEVPGAPYSLIMDNGTESEWVNLHDSPPHPSLPVSSPNRHDLSSSHHHHHHQGTVDDQGFAHMKLRMSPGNATISRSKSDRKISPEKAQSLGWAGNTESDALGMPNYFTSASSMTTTTPPGPSSVGSNSRTPLSLTPRADGNWFFDKPTSASASESPLYASRPRSNTMSDLNLSPGSFHSGNANNANSAQSPPQGKAQSTSTHLPGSSDHHNSHHALPHQHSTPSMNTSENHQSGHPATSSPTVTKTKALSTDTLLDAADDSDCPSTLPPERAKGVSVPDIAHSLQQDDARNPNPIVRNSPERKTRKSKDRDRRRSLIQAVSDFFTIRGSSSSGSGAQSQNGSPTDKSSSHHSTSGSANTNNTSSSFDGGAPDSNGAKEKFSLFKLTPKILQSAKDRRNSKSRENILSPPPPAPSSPPGPAPSCHIPHASLSSTSSLMIDPNHPPPKPARAAFNTYLTQPEMVIQRLNASPSTYKSHRTSQGHSRSSYDGGVEQSGGLGQAVDHMATLSIVATPHRPNRGVGRGEYHHRIGDRGLNSRIRQEMQEIQLQLESVDQQQRSLEARGVAVEKKIRGEEPDEKHREEAELMEEWFTLVREKTRLARFEKELLVRAEELELEARKVRLEEQLDSSLLVKDEIKSPEDRNREIELLHEIRAVEEQRGKLLTSFQEDIRHYENEDADLEAKIASSRLSPKESNV